MKQTFKEAGYSYLYSIKYTGKGKRGHVLHNHNTGTNELFYASKDYAGWGLIYKNTHLEFACTIKETAK